MQTPERPEITIAEAIAERKRREREDFARCVAAAAVAPPVIAGELLDHAIEVGARKAH